MFFRTKSESLWQWISQSLKGVVMTGIGLVVTSYAPVLGFRMIGLALLVDCVLHCRNPEVPTDRYDPYLCMTGRPARMVWIALVLLSLGLIFGAGFLGRFFFLLD